MNKIWMLATANIKKAKGSTFGVFTLLLIAAMLLNVGATMLGVNGFFESEMERLNSPHIVFTQSYHLESNDQLQFLQNHEGITDVAYARTLFNSGSVRDVNDNPFVDISLFISYTHELTGNYAMLPLGTNLLSNHTPGAHFGVDFGTETLRFTLYDTFEHHLLDNPNGMPRGFYISYEHFNTLWNSPQFVDAQYYLIYATLEDPAAISRITTDYIMAFNSPEFMPGGTGLFTFDINQAQEFRTMIPSVIAIFLFLFSIILLVVSIVVIRFRIVNSIEEGMKNIGVLKSLGFKSTAIILAYVLQFAIIAIVAAIIGVGLSYVITPLLTGISEPMLGLYWAPGFNMALAIVAVISVVSVTSLFVFLSALKVRPLFPIMALRGGLKNHNFKKNYFGLHKFFAPLNLQLALKSLFQAKKQAVAMIIITTALTFSAIFGVVVLYNMQINTTAFINMVGGEVLSSSDLIMLVRTDDDNVRNQIIAHDHVDELFRIDFNPQVIVNDILTRVVVFDDPAFFSDEYVLEGRLPIYSNEVAVNRPASAEFDAGVGSWLDIGDERFLVSAIVRDADGFFTPGVTFNLQGAQAVIPNFEFTSYAITVIDGVGTGDLYDYIQSHFSDITFAAISTEVQGDMIMEAIAPPFVMVSSVIVVAVFFVIIMVLYLIIGTTILRRKKDLGIQKAMGFTSFQLMKQIALNLTPVIMVGATIGIALGYAFINPALGQLMIMLGLEPGNMFLPAPYMFGAGGIVVALSYVISLAIAGRIRKISAYEMVTE